MSLAAAKPVLDAVSAHAAEAYPEECCGALIGPVPDDFDAPARRVFAVEARRLGNSWEAGDARARRYAVEPGAVARLERELAGTGRAIIGWYHSHPDVPAWPSPFDLERAWPCYSYLIVQAAKGKVVDARSWVRSADGRSFQEEPVEVLQEA